MYIYDIHSYMMYNTILSEFILILIHSSLHSVKCKQINNKAIKYYSIMKRNNLLKCTYTE